VTPSEVLSSETSGSSTKNELRLDRSMNDDKRLARFGGSYRAASELLAFRFGPTAGLAGSLVGRFVALTILTWFGAEAVRKLIGPSVTTLFDAPVVQYAAGHRNAGLTSVMKAVTTAGNDLYLWIAVLIGGTILARLTRSWRPLLLVVLAMLGAVTLNYIIKLAVARTRPPSLFWAIPANGWSFPSGHATESAAVYGTLSNLSAGTQSRPGVKILTYAMGIAAPLLIGISRVYLGVHWPTDVVVGWALGYGWSAIVLTSSSAVQCDRLTS
jgi:membrane-associated phospholipid phosphatase